MIVRLSHLPSGDLQLVATHTSVGLPRTPDSGKRPGDACGPAYRAAGRGWTPGRFLTQHYENDGRVSS
jgi:hypothetical protein